MALAIIAFLWTGRLWAEQEKSEIVANLEKQAEIPGARSAPLSIRMRQSGKEASAYRSDLP